MRENVKTLFKLYKEREQWLSKLSPMLLICFNVGVSNTESVLRNLKEGLERIRASSEK
jgi:hypothetical protein